MYGTDLLVLNLKLHYSANTKTEYKENMHVYIGNKNVCKKNYNLSKHKIIDCFCTKCLLEQRN